MGAATDANSGRLRPRLYSLAFVDEFGPVYAVYTLWFNDNGIDATQLSGVFLAWAVVSLVLEVPSGVLADRVDRRRLLAVAFAIRAGGIALWLLWPTLAGIVVGAVLWAVHDALASGAWEAMIHDQLSARRDEHRYGQVMARISQFSNLGVATGTVVGAALLGLDVGLATLGWLTVLAHVGSISLVLTLPDVRPAPGGDDSWVHESSGGEPEPATVRAGLRAARRSPVLARLVVLGALIEGMFLVDEYLPLVARARGGSEAAATLLVLVVWLGLLAGGELAARRPDLGPHRLGLGVSAGAALILVALVSGSVAALAAVAVGYAVLEAARVVADARLQERADGALRATVTSLRGFGASAVSMGVFVVIGALSDGDDPSPGLHALVLGILVLGGLLAWWLPRPTRRPLGVVS